jgi:hypothetical protein
MFFRHTRDLALLLPCLPRAGLVGSTNWAWWKGEKSDRAPVEGRDGLAKTPTSRKEREKWGTRQRRTFLQDKRGTFRLSPASVRSQDESELHPCTQGGTMPFKEMLL